MLGSRGETARPIGVSIGLPDDGRDGTVEALDLPRPPPDDPTARP